MATQNYETALSLYIPTETKRFLLVSTAHGRELFNEAFQGFTCFAGVASKRELNMNFNTGEEVQRYLSMLYDDDRTLSIEELK